MNMKRGRSRRLTYLNKTKCFGKRRKSVLKLFTILKPLFGTILGLGLELDQA
jgi:hypothetical protein